MTNINDTVTYPNTLPASDDFVIGTDVSDTGTSPDGQVVTFTFGDIKAFILNEVGLEAFESLSAGNSVRSQRTNVSVATDPGVWATVHQAGFLQIGTIRARVQSGSGSARSLRVTRTRAGVNTVVAGPTTGTILTADIGVLPGDGLFLQVDGTVSDTTLWQGDFLTNGENLWPASIVNVSGNTY